MGCIKFRDWNLVRRNELKKSLGKFRPKVIKIFQWGLVVNIPSQIYT